MSSVTELLLLPDGQVLVHNLTPAMATLLKEFDLQDREIALRASLARKSPTRVAAAGSRRILAAAQMAPTDVGGYTLSTNRAGCEVSGSVSPSVSKL